MPSTLQFGGNSHATSGGNTDRIAQTSVNLFPDQSVPPIDPIGQDLFSGQPGRSSAPPIDPVGQDLFPSQFQGLTAPPIDPVGQDLFFSQFRDSPAPHIDPAEHLLHQPHNTSTPNADNLIPQSLRLSSPELITAVGNVIDNIQRNLDKHGTQNADMH